MAVRTIVTSNHLIDVSQGNIPSTTGDVTVAAVFKKASDLAGATSHLLCFGQAGDNANFFLGGSSPWVFSLWNGAGTTASTLGVALADGWVVGGITHASGSNVRGHKYVFSTRVASHANSAGTQANSAPTGNARIGNNSVATLPLNGDMAVLGVWNRVLTDAEFETLANSLPTWLGLSPSALWVFDQGSVATNITDLTGGGANQAAITGTSVTADWVPGWAIPGHSFQAIPF